MTDAEFACYMRAAALDRVMVSGEQIDRLRMLAGAEKPAMPANYWSTVDLANVEWALNQAKKRGAL